MPAAAADSIRNLRLEFAMSRFWRCFADATRQHRSFLCKRGNSILCCAYGQMSMPWRGGPTRCERRAEYTGTVASPGIAGPILRFGAFELDLRNGELRRAGVLIKLSPQQIRVLRYLAENAGRICTREEIQQEIWGSEVFVDFDRGLNVSIAQIRAALNDDSEAPRFIQ